MPFNEQETANSNWTVETLKQHLTSSINAMQASINLQFEDRDKRQTMVLDEREKRYMERFKAQEHAVQIASQAEQTAVRAMLAASDKAIVKAEQAQAQHNASQNEWRATVTDLTKTMADRLRVDSETSVGNLSKRTDQMKDSLAEKIDHIQSRLDRTEGRSTGLQAHISTLISVIGLMISLGSLLLAISITSAKTPVVPPAPRSSLYTVP